MITFETIKRYFVFLIGLVLTAFGVALITKAALGTSPIAAIPYSLSLISGRLTLGLWIVIFNLTLVASQAAIEGRKCVKAQILIEAALTFLFGYSVDAAMSLLWALNPASYAAKAAALLAGCCVISLGAYLEVIADVAMLPYDGFVRALSRALKKEYVTLRVFLDVTMSAAAAALCLIFLGGLAGVREGTAASALLVGSIVKIYARLFSGAANRIFPRTEEAAKPAGIPSGNLIIAISREYGSGGRNIGKKIAEALGVPYYDAELIRMFAQEGGYTEDFVREFDEKMTPSQYKLYSWYVPALPDRDKPKAERLFHIEERVINEIASRGSCVIVGRLAGHILRGHKNVLHVFITAGAEAKIRRVMARDGLTRGAARAQISKVEKERAAHCLYFTHTEWGKAENYDLSVKSDKYGIDETSSMLTAAAGRLAARISQLPPASA